MHMHHGTQMHQAKLDRINRLSDLDLDKGKGPKFELHIASCAQLKAGGMGDRNPDPYVVAQVWQLRHARMSA